MSNSNAKADYVPMFGPGGWAEHLSEEAITAEIEHRRDPPQEEVPVDKTAWGPWPRREMVCSEEDWLRAQLAPRCIVQNYLYADVALLAAPGSTGKTTMLLYESVCIALGMDVWGLRCESPGWTLFVTREDEHERLIARLREICVGMELTAEQTATVRQSVTIFDVTGGEQKLLHMDGNNIIRTELAKRIVECYRDDAPAVVIFDPTISFGASESMVNDNEDALVQVARHIVRELKACVRYVHHTGKANARAEKTDMYSARGGSALPDGSRMMTALSVPAEKERPPEGCRPGDGIGIFKLERHKISYAKPNLPPIWIRREGFVYTSFVELSRTAEERALAKADQLERFITERLKQGEYHTPTSLRDIRDEFGMSQPEVRAAVSKLRSQGRLVDVHMPDGQRHGNRRTYLCPLEMIPNG